MIVPKILRIHYPWKHLCHIGGNASVSIIVEEEMGELIRVLGTLGKE